MAKEIALGEWNFRLWVSAFSIAVLAFVIKSIGILLLYEINSPKAQIALPLASSRFSS